MIKRIFFFAAAVSIASAPAHGQVIDPNVVDRLVAVVGDSSVVMTQVIEQIQQMELQGAPVPDENTPEYETFFRRVLDEFVNRLLVLQAAARDSLIQVDDAAIEEMVNERINQLSQQFGGQAALQQALAAEALTLAELRESFKAQARMERIQQMFFQLRMRDAAPVEVTEEEMLARFQQQRGQLQQRPRLVTFRQVVVVPEATGDAVEAARTEAQSLLERIEAGEPIADLALEHSDDPGSRALGGDLGWFRRGKMVREFEDAAFAILEGIVPELVETDYGFHIIEVERARPGERSARHILVIPERTEGDLVRARETAHDVLSQARNGTPMSELFSTYSDPAAPDSLTVPFEQLGQFPPAYGALRSASSGDFIGPLEYQIGADETQIAVVEVVEVREAGAWTFEDMRGQIAAQLQQEKQVEQIVESLRARTYVSIRM